MRSRYALYALAVMVGINFLNYLDRFMLSVAAPSIQVEFHLSDTAVGLLGSAFLLVYALAAPPFGIWADRSFRRTVIGVGVAIWSVATVFTGLAASYWQLLVTRSVLGIGEASYYPAGTSLLGDYFPKKSRGRAMSVWTAGASVGIAVAFGAGGIIVSRFGWRAAFFLTAIPGLVFAFLAFTLREPARGAVEAAGPKLRVAADAGLASFRELLKIRALAATIAAETLLFFVLAGNAYWLPLYLHRRFGYGIGAAGLVAGAVLVGGGLIGTLLGGWLADRLARRSPAAHLQVGIAGFLLGAAFVTIALLATSIPIFMPAFFLAATSLYLYSGPFTAIKQNVVIPSLRATAVTLSLFIEHLFGDSASPWLIGVVSDWLHSLTAALLVLSPALLLAAAGAAALGLRHVGRDAEAMESAWARREAAPQALTSAPA